MKKKPDIRVLTGAVPPKAGGVTRSRFASWRKMGGRVSEKKLVAERAPADIKTGGRGHPGYGLAGPQRLRPASDGRRALFVMLAESAFLSPRNKRGAGAGESNAST